MNTVTRPWDWISECWVSLLLSVHVVAAAADVVNAHAHTGSLYLGMCSSCPSCALFVLIVVFIFLQYSGKSGSGRVRAPLKKEQKQNVSKKLRVANLSSGQTNGLNSSLVFTPVQVDYPTQKCVCGCISLSLCCMFINVSVDTVAF